MSKNANKKKLNSEKMNKSSEGKKFNQTFFYEFSVQGWNRKSFAGIREDPAEEGGEGRD